MSRRLRLGLVGSVLCLTLLPAADRPGHAPAYADVEADFEEGEIAVPPDTATGSFDVQLTPRDAGAGLGRMRMEKQFHGDLQATSQGEMLSWREEGGLPAAYVAIERVTGTLHGRSGSFVLTHRGTMTGEDQHLTVEIVPGSGTEELEGLRGAMTILVADGRHEYQLEYSLPEK